MESTQTTDAQPSTDLATRQVAIQPHLMDDEQIRLAYRVAESLYLSGAFKDVKKPEAAFAKILLGRDLGLSPTESMLGLHLVEGTVQVHYAMLARFIKAREEDGYKYRAGWLKQNPPGGGAANEPAPPATREAVWMNDDDPADDREVVGAFVEFTINDEVVGLSRFTLADAMKANLIKDGMDRRAAWMTSRRNMFLARAMSNGVKWFVPEVMGGLPIYVDGEVPKAPDVTAPVGDGDDEGTGLELGPKVEKIIARAKELGHVGLSNRRMIEMKLGGRAPSVVDQFVKDAKLELDRFAAEKAAEDEPPEVEVVPDEKPPDVPDAVVTPADVVDPHAAANEAALNEMGDTIHRTRLARLEEMRAEEQDPEIRAQLDAEMEYVREQLGESS